MPGRLAPPGPPAAPFVITGRAVAGWVLYDLANTIFSMGVVSVYFSLYVSEAVGAQRADRVYGVITAVSMGITFLVSPFEAVSLGRRVLRAETAAVAAAALISHFWNE